MTSAVPEQGQLVHVRARRWVVTEVTASTLPPDLLHPTGQPPQHLLTLSSVEDDGLGEELRVLWELEPGAKVLEKVALPEPTGFDPPDRLDAFLDAVRWGAISSADVRSIQSPFRSGIEIEDYQLDPVVRALQMPRVNLLIADDVGLGKTIEAGLVALELILRHRARKILIVCPSSLQVQWKEQMRDKFGLDFRIVDTELMKELRRSRGIHVNPWGHFPRLITSIDFLKRERPLRVFRELLPGPNESKYPRKFDLLIVDEAHNVAPSGTGRYATDSLRTQAVRMLAPHFEHKLFLTATPHNGYRESFSALLELLDNQRFARATDPDSKQLAAVMVRRMKAELRPNWDGTPRFPRRILEPLEVPYSDEEKAVHAKLRTYARLREQRSADTPERIATDFVLKTLKKRLFSSPAAFAATLGRHESSLRSARRPAAAQKPTIGVLRRELERMDEDYASDETYDEATADAVETAGRLFSEPTAEELALIHDMKTWATSASARLDSKARELIQWLQANLRPSGHWSDHRVILFTEYRATQNWLAEVLTAEHLGGERMLTMYGGMDSADRERVKAAFQAAPDVSPVRILLATDAASEGLDLQNWCSRLIHYEIPWNPNRMEQRNGRIDRHGQRSSEVHVFHFVGQGYRERELASAASSPGDLEADLEFLMRVARKVEKIREDLGKVGPVLADQVEEAMLGRRKNLDTAHAEREAAPLRKLLKFERDVDQRCKELDAQFRETQRELRLGSKNVQKVVEVALELAGQPALASATVSGIWPNPKAHECPVFYLPPLRGSWAACAEGLEHPHTREVRPIVFDHGLVRKRDDVVLVHLNHRLVQMSLRLLRAEVWSVEGRKRLHRITARRVPDSILDAPAMIGHARLVVISADSHRLHEELITAGGRIQEGRFTRLNVGQIDGALAAAGDQPTSDGVQKRLLELWPQLVPSLAQALEARMKDRSAGLQKKLAERAEKEAQDVDAILSELERTIQTELGGEQPVQLGLFNLEEREQFERNRSMLAARLAAIPEERAREIAGIRARYAEPQARLFPVAVTFLVPERLA